MRLAILWFLKLLEQWRHKVRIGPEPTHSYPEP
jgi:hypothetical protein